MARQLVSFGQRKARRCKLLKVGRCRSDHCRMHPVLVCDIVYDDWQLPRRYNGQPVRTQRAGQV